MAISMILSLLIALFSFSPSFSTPISSQNKSQDLVTAIKQMRKGNYFTFITLINMSPLDQFLQNVTFLMPKDRLLSDVRIPQDSVLEFLLRHAIPSPLIFEHLEHIPTGSVIPTMNPRYMLTVSNNGRRNFAFNNVRIVSPNICIVGLSIRCHGIDGVLLVESNNTSRSSSCSCPKNGGPSPADRPLAPPFLPPSSSVAMAASPAPATAPALAPESSMVTHKSSSSMRDNRLGSIDALIMTSLLVITMLCM